PGKNILYMNLEDFRFGYKRGNDLLDSIYNKFMELKRPSGRLYILFDEIQNVNNFEQWLRTFYDINQNIKFIITGSSSELLSGEFAALLTGRHISLNIYPFSFKEYLMYKNPEILRSAIEKNGGSLHLTSISQKITSALQKFMLSGGFPEIIISNKLQRNKLLLQQYLEDILLKDIAKRYGIRDIITLEKLALYLLSNNSNEVSVNRITKILNSSRPTISALLNYMKQVYLIDFTANFSFSLNERLNMKKPQKIYSIDTGMFSAVKQTMANDYSKMAENLVFLHLKHNWKQEVFFWKDKIEIDFVLNNGFPINVTFTDNIPEREFEGLIYYLEKHNLKQGILVTKNLFERLEENNHTIHYIPLWRFLLFDSYETLLSKL
ncbi:MAG: ATP-binding protein, partial [Calditrichales bacterium]|nr:ATP-binding protein [Calditrichales bacterium]